MGKLVQFLVVIALLLGLASCSASRQSANPKKNYYYTHAFHAHNIIHRDPSLGPDTAIVHKVAVAKDTTKTPPTLAHLSKLQRLFGRKAKPQEVVAEPGHIDLPAGWPPPKKCKGCQISITIGTGNTVAQSTAGKKSTPTLGDNNKVSTGTNKGNLALADSSAQVIDQAKAGQAAANTGAGSTSSQVQAEAEKTWQDYLLGPVGKVLGLIVFIVFILLLIAWKRRRDANAASS